MTKGILENHGSGLKIYGLFLAKRYYRLWFPYFFAVIIIYLWMIVWPVEGRCVPFGVFLIDLFCIIHPGIDCVDGAHWFIQTLFVSQFLLGSLLLIRSTDIRRNCLFCIAILSLICKLELLPQKLCYLFNSLYLAEITIGMVLSYAVKDKNWFAITLCLIATLLALFKSLELFIFLLLFVVLVTIKVQFSNSRITCLLDNLGEVCFIWYLVHQNIGYSIQNRLVPHGDVFILWVLVPMFITFGIATFISIICSLLTPNVLSKRLFHQ